jgi:hypothetical protein
LWRPGCLMQQSITLLLGQIALTQPGGLLGHCPVEKQIIVPLSANLMAWHIAAECCDSHAGYGPHESPHTITLHPACYTVGITYVEILRSCTLHLTKTWRLEPKMYLTLMNLSSAVEVTLVFLYCDGPHERQFHHSA